MKAQESPFLLLVLHGIETAGIEFQQVRGIVLGF
jgi:hypothetical protein